MKPLCSLRGVGWSMARGRHAARRRPFPGLTVCSPLPPDPSPVPSSSSTYHAIIGGIVAFIVFLLLILLIFLGHYLIRHKGQRREGASRRALRADREIRRGRQGRRGQKEGPSESQWAGVSETLGALVEERTRPTCDN